MDLVNNSQQIGKENSGNLINHTLQDLIASQGMSQADFARKISVDRAYINRVLRGKTIPPREMMIKISKALGVDSRVIWP